MIGIIGLVLIFVMVFGGYIAAGGKMPIILHALPYEMVIILGAAVGAFAISNDMAGVKHTLKDVGKVFKGSKWKNKDYQDLLCLLFELIRLGRQNPMALEEPLAAVVDGSGAEGGARGAVEAMRLDTGAGPLEQCPCQRVGSARARRPSPETA